MKKIACRKAKKEDLKATSEIYIQCLQKDYYFKPEEYLKKLNLMQEVEECQEWLKEDPENNLIFVAEKHKKILGYVSTGLNKEEPLDYEGELTGLFVHPDYQGKGIGLCLMQTGCEAFKSLKIEKFLVYNYRRSRANRFYRNLGGFVVRTETQKPGGMPLITDVFGFQTRDLLVKLEGILNKRNECKED